MKKIISFAALVLLLTLASCAVHPEASGMAEKPDLVPMVRVEGTLYRDTGNESQAENHSGTRAGKITSTVSACLLYTSSILIHWEMKQEQHERDLEMTKTEL